MGLFKKKIVKKTYDRVEQGFHYLLGTVHPDNIASVNSFLQLNYQQVMMKEKYGGMKRCIFCKKI